MYGVLPFAPAVESYRPPRATSHRELSRATGHQGWDDDRTGNGPPAIGGTVASTAGRAELN
ncbi:hypothetical protein PtA15_10A91 [Puccinia triticina]|uniref:Uncharacterized protein n=1 Tax=Puccinia triticina TaxID=208348 RepID=A0ABY7CW44_9BASI|nr:uncharacterized protein PtA15_10A91 [Puccinia triticina]WAQ88672.1 hypothetical protein PtA15_10A91 [Puccinia triticina]WAR58749.1 hypothetical protein PtB15_10B88 [Puccinia triticina]